MRIPLLVLIVGGLGLLSAALALFGAEGWEITYNGQVRGLFRRVQAGARGRGSDRLRSTWVLGLASRSGRRAGNMPTLR